MASFFGWIPLQYYELSGLINFVTSFSLCAFILVRNVQAKANRIFALFCFAVAQWSFFYFLWLHAKNPAIADFFLKTCMIGVIFMPSIFTHFIGHLLGLKIKPKIIFANYLVSTLISALVYTSLYAYDGGPFLVFSYWAKPGILFPLHLIHFSINVVYSHYKMAEAIRKTRGVTRNQIKYVFIGTTIGYLAGVTNYFCWYRIPIPPIPNVLISLYVVSVAYSIVKYRLMDIRIAAVRTLLFILVYIPILTAPFLLGLVFRGALERIFGNNWWMLPVAASSLLAPAGLYIYFTIKNKAEALFFKEQRRYQQALIQISETMTLIKELDHLLDLIVQKVKTLVGIKDVCLFVDDKTDQYVLKTLGHENGFPKDLRFSGKDPIIKHLVEYRSSIIREEILAGKSQKGRESDLEAISSLMQRYGIALIIPSFVQDSLLGFMTLGEKSDGRMYTQDDLNVFEALANQAALAIENAIFYEAQGKSLAQELQEHKLKYLGNMASNMCHDLNNRFNGIVIQTFEIFDAIIPAIKEFFKTHSHEKGLDDLLGRLIENLKIIEHHAMAGGETVERFRQQSRQAKIEVLSLIPLIENSLLLVTHPKEKTGDVAKIIPREEYGLEIKIPDGFPKLSGEVFSLENAIGNMLRNACAAQEKKKESIKKGELKIQSYSPKVIVSAHVADAMAVITIQDNGIGMTKDQLGQMFVPFFTTKVKGTGLGLSILKTMIELQGGKVSVESEYAKGTTFTISLPQAKEGGEDA